MWTANTEALEDGRTIRVSLPLPAGEVFQLWRENSEFRTFFTVALMECPFSAFFWETPPYTVNSLDRPFEFVQVRGDFLSTVMADPSSFAGHFTPDHHGEPVVTFPNLGGDAILVVPAPLPDVENSCYPHLASFLSGAPGAQVDELWRKTGEAMIERLSVSPTWLSTAGLGVSWLHIRLDSIPKYYHHKPYRNAALHE